jgi:hypothetical protein
MAGPGKDAFSQAYDLTLRRLDLQDHEDPVAIFIADKIQGIVSAYFLRDPHTISEEAIRLLSDVLQSPYI